MNRFLALILIGAPLFAQRASYRDLAFYQHAPQQLLLSYGAVANLLTLSHKSCATAGSGASIAVTLTGSIANGDLLLIGTETTAAVNVTTLSAGGTWVQTPNMSGDGGVHYLNTGYVYPATATAGPVTINYDATAGADSGACIYDYTVSGAPSLAAVSTYFDHDATSPFTQPAITLSGTGCAVLTMVKSNGSVTAVNGSWTDTSFGGNMGTADQVGVTSVTTPTWTATMGIGVASSIAFCFNPTTSVNWELIDFSAGSNGGTPTQSDLHNSSHGAMGDGPAASNARNDSYWEIASNATPGWKYAASAYLPLLNPAPRFLISGVQYSDTSTVGLEFDTSTNNSLIRWSPGKEYGANQAFLATTQTMAYSFWTDIPATVQAPSDDFTIESPAGKFVTAQLEADGTQRKVGLEGSVTGGKINYSGSTQYYLCHKFVTNGTGELHMYDATGVDLAGSPLTIDQTAATGNNTTDKADRYIMGWFGAAALTGGGHFRIGKMKICNGNGGAVCTCGLP